MAENSGIEWTDHTFNPWMGCTKVSPACKNCYAERDFDHRYGKVQWGPNGTRVLTSDENWRKPLRWNRDASQWRYCVECGEAFSLANPCGCDIPKAGAQYRARVFCASLADVFEDWGGAILRHDGCSMWICPGCGAWRDGALPEIQTHGPSCASCNLVCHPLEMRDIRRRLFSLIDDTPNLDWLLLTKRPENIRSMWPGGYRHNVWLGTSVENQEWADKRIPVLLSCSDLAPVRFLSCEPLVGEVDISPWLWGLEKACDKCPLDADCPCGYETRENLGSPSLSWVITGGESGPDARACDPDWFRSLRDQCLGAGVPFHFKQWGEWAPFSDSLYERCRKADTHGFSEDSVVYRVGKKAAGRLLDGTTHDGVPVVTATKA